MKADKIQKDILKDLIKGEWKKVNNTYLIKEYKNDKTVYVSNTYWLVIIPKDRYYLSLDEEFLKGISNQCSININDNLNTLIPKSLDDFKQVHIRSQRIEGQGKHKKTITKFSNDDGLEIYANADYLKLFEDWATFYGSGATNLIIVKEDDNIVGLISPIRVSEENKF